MSMSLWVSVKRSACVSPPAAWRHILVSYEQGVAVKETRQDKPRGYAEPVRTRREEMMLLYFAPCLLAWSPSQFEFTMWQFGHLGK